MGHYNSLAGSYGYQAGLQTYGYALFLMNDQALQYLDRSDGWEIGVGPSIVVLDKGKGIVGHPYDAHEGRLRLHLQPGGPDGGCGHSGLEDHEGEPVGTQRPHS